jgi:hypothetical protein
MSKLAEIVQYLASRCDGAIQQDSAGYNKGDSYFGKAIAAFQRNIGDMMKP